MSRRILQLRGQSCFGTSRAVLMSSESERLRANFRSHLRKTRELGKGWLLKILMICSGSVSAGEIFAQFSYQDM